MSDNRLVCRLPLVPNIHTVPAKTGTAMYDSTIRDLSAGRSLRFKVGLYRNSPSRVDLAVRIFVDGIGTLRSITKEPLPELFPEDKFVDAVTCVEAAINNALLTAIDKMSLDPPRISLAQLGDWQGPCSDMMSRVLVDTFSAIRAYVDLRKENLRA